MSYDSTATKAQAIIMRSSDVYDADRLYLALTDTYGKIRMRAKGVRRPTSKLTGHLLAYVPTTVELQESQGFFLVTSAQSQFADAYPNHNLDFLQLVEVAAEALDRLLLEHEPHPDVYAAFSYVIERLRESPHELLVAEFLYKIVNFLGYQPILEHCAQTGEALVGDRLAWSSAAGGVYNVPDGYVGDRIQSKTVVALREMAKPAFIAERLHMPDNITAEVLRVIYDYVQTVIGMPLRSLSMLTQTSR
jgi:DNA repair protein RecO (recombination protein O)